MNKKSRNICELMQNLFEDDILESDELWKDLRCLTYAPNIGYTCWIFRYKGTLVCLSNHLGNGHWNFHSAVTLLDLIFAKISMFKDTLACRK